VIFHRRRTDKAFLLHLEKMKALALKFASSRALLDNPPSERGESRVAR
jgi:hypothetical protein